MYLPTTAAEVKGILDRSSAIGTIKDNTDLSKISVFNTQINALKNLYNITYNQAISFFNSISIKEGSLGERLKTLQNRLTEIEQAARINYNQLFKAVMSNPKIISTLDKIDTESVDNALQSVEWDLGDLTGKDEEQVYDLIIDQFSQMIQAEDKKSGYFANLSGKGLRRILEIKFDETTNIINIKFKDGQKISSELKNKLVNVITQYTHTKMVTSKDSFKKLVTDALLNCISTKSSLLASCIRHEVYVNYDKYDLSRSFSSLRGFIQEVWVNALVSAVSGRAGSSTPTGNIRTAVTNGEIPIDMVLREAKFQIKKFTLDQDGNYQITPSPVRAGNFITDYAPDSLSKLLIELFGSYQFNQPFSSEVKISPNNAMTVSEYSSDVYSKFDEIITEENMSQVFQSSMDKIMRIDKVFSGDTGFLFAKEQMYFNTFFFVNDMIIPACTMIKSIIKSIEDTELKRMLNFTMTNISSPVQNEGTLEAVILSDPTENWSKKRYAGSAQSIANSISLSYKVDINFTDLFNDALATAQRMEY